MAPQTGLWPKHPRQNRVCCFGCLKKGFKVSSGPVQWYRSSCGTDFENAEIGSPIEPCLIEAYSLNHLDSTYDLRKIPYLRPFGRSGYPYTGLANYG